MLYFENTTIINIKSNTYKQMKKKLNTISIFLLSFIGWFITFVLTAKFFKIREIDPLSWEEICSNLHLFLITAFLVAIIFTIRVKW